MRYVVLASLLLILAGCSGGFNSVVSNPEHEEYYQGTEGVEMRLVPGSPPPTLFYYGDTTDITDNEFDVSIELHNQGASDAIGALYISGFSPDILTFEGTTIEERGISDCYFDFSLFELGSGATDISFFASCYGFEVGHGGAGEWEVRLQNIGTIFGIDFTGIGFEYGGDDLWSLHLGWDAFGGLDFLNRGRALILVLSAIDFERYNGYLFSEDAGILMGDNYQFPGGEQGFVNIIGHVGDDWPAGLDEIDQTLLITSCYGYTTFASPLVCIDPAPFDQTTKVCTPREYSWAGSQGAPVAITGLKQDPTPRKMFLTFTIEDVGGGTVINPGYLERCSPYFPGRFDSRHKDTVYIGDVRIGNQRLTCNPDFAVRLNNGRGTFTCEYDLEFTAAKSAYETPVVIELWYGYQETEQTTIHIKRAG